MTNTLNPPPEVVNSWPPPNYDDPETRGPGLFVLTVVLIILGGFIIAIRTYTRIRLTRAFGLDDGLILISYLFAVAFSSLVIVGNRQYYSGYHVWDVPRTTFVPHRHNIWWSELTYVLASCSVKISILLFYRRLCLSFTKKFMWATYVGLFINILYLFVFVIWLCVVCQPLNAYWDSFNPAWRKAHSNYMCRSENILSPLAAGLSVVTDLYGTLVPIFLIAMMQRSMKEKVTM